MFCTRCGRKLEEGEVCPCMKETGKGQPQIDRISSCRNRSRVVYRDSREQALGIHTRVSQGRDRRGILTRVSQDRDRREIHTRVSSIRVIPIRVSHIRGSSSGASQMQDRIRLSQRLRNFSGIF